MATCMRKSSSKKAWLIDSGYTRHMNIDFTLFFTLDRSCTINVKVGNGVRIQAQGKGSILVCTPIETKTIFTVLYVSKIA